jgi:glycosyltransferase involved in cell wall biosynthesis
VPPFRKPPEPPYDATELEKLSDKGLGVYIDVVYRLVEARDGRRLSTDRSFLLFVEAVGADFDRVVLFGRTIPSGTDAEYVLPDTVELVALPHYANLRRLGQVTAASAQTVARVWRGLDRVDVLWAFGPHPFTALAALLALLRRKQVVLGVRQYSVRLYRVRVKGWKKGPAVTAMWLLDGIFRVLARRVRIAVQGAELAERYGGSHRPNVHTMTESVVRAADLAAEVPRRDWNGVIELLTVGRLETEKNPVLLVEALARLERERPGRFHLTWVGRGPLERLVMRRAAELGVDGLITLIGYVPFGPALLDLYRQAHVFVHVSLSEGMPKVLIEAMACATPVVATDVGGVRDALGGGSAGALVPPDDLDELVGAVERVVDDPVLRDRITEHGSKLVKTMTLEAEAERFVRFLRGDADTRPATGSVAVGGTSRADT